MQDGRTMDMGTTVEPSCWANEIGESIGCEGRVLGFFAVRNRAGVSRTIDVCHLLVWMLHQLELVLAQPVEIVVRH